MTTLEYNGVEKSLADWGFEISASLTLTNQANDIFAATIPTATITDTPIFPFEAQVIVRQDGVLEFTGKRLRELIAVSGNSAGVTYQFAGPWYDLEHTVYQQKTAGYNNATRLIEYTYQSEVILYTRLNDANVLVPCTNGQQIADILQFVIDMCAAANVPAPFQLGTFDPGVNLPSQICKPMMCAAAIEKCLELSPDCTFYFDYTTSPPTANVRARANATPLSLPLFDGVSHKSIRIEPRLELQAPAVILKYKRQNTTNGQAFITFDVDKFPANGPEAGLRVIIESIDLAGFQFTSVSGTLDVEPVAAIGGTDASKRAWWGSQRGGEEKMFSDTKLRLQDYLHAATHIPDATVVDETGATLNPATGHPWLTDYPNRLVDGSIHPWMFIVLAGGGNAGVVGKRLKLKIVLPCTEYDVPATGNAETATNGKMINSYGAKEFVCNLTLTNGISGTYSAPASFVGGEATPTDIAQAVYTSLAQLQYEGDSVWVSSSSSSSFPTMGNVLNLSSGRAEWATMNAQIQSIRKTYGMGYTEVSIGPAKHLNAGELASIFNALRFRRVWYNPALRQNASGSGSNVEITRNNPKANTTHGTNDPVNTTNSTGSTAADATIEMHSSVVATVVAGKTPVDASHPPQNVKMIELATCDPETGASYKRCMPAGGAYT